MAPTGLKNSSEDLGTATTVGKRSAIMAVIQLIFSATNVPQQFPSYLVPLGCSVSLRGDSEAAVNAQLAFAALYPAALLAGGRRQVITPDTEVAFPVDNTGQIWAMGTEGDGLICTVRGGATG